MITRRPFCLAAFAALSLNLLPASTQAGDGKIYEMRTYVANEGKLEALLQRFRNHTCRLFEKHGMTNIGYWVPLDKADGAEDTLIYIVAHASREAAKESWKAFGADPEWQAARKASEEGGKILAMAPESVFMDTTEYSVPVAVGVSDKERVFELRIYNTPAGKLDALHARFKNHTIGLFTKHGMTHLGYWTPVDEDKGAGTKLIYLLAHANREAAKASFAAFRADPAWVAAKEESEKNGSLTLQPDGVKSIFMRAVDFSPIR